MSLLTDEEFASIKSSCAAISDLEKQRRIIETKIESLFTEYKDSIQVVIPDMNSLYTAASSNCNTDPLTCVLMNRLMSSKPPKKDDINNILFFTFKHHELRGAIDKLTDSIYLINSEVASKLKAKLPK